MDNINMPPQIKPSNNMVFAILTTIFCCLPFGIVAIVFASKVDALWASGNYPAAYDAAAKAKNWSIIAAACGALWIIVYVILICTGVMTSFMDMQSITAGN